MPKREGCICLETDQENWLEMMLAEEEAINKAGLKHSEITVTKTSSVAISDSFLVSLKPTSLGSPE